MTLTLRQTVRAVGPGAPASFQAYGGTEPYLYSVLPGGAGGTIDPSTGIYRAPASAASEGPQLYDTIQVTDYSAATATASILVGLPLLLFCDILQHEMNLADGRVYLWDQKIFQPKDQGLYIAVSAATPRAFGNTNRFNSVTNQTDCYVSMVCEIMVDAISRGPAARDRKEEIILAMGSNYAEQQMNNNSFYVARLPTNGGRFVNLSDVDGAAIPYRYQIRFNMQYAYAKAQAVEYFDGFETPEIAIDP